MATDLRLAQDATGDYSLLMSTLAEIEAAVKALPRTQQEELFAFLAERIGVLRSSALMRKMPSPRSLARMPGLMRQLDGRRRRFFTEARRERADFPGHTSHLRVGGSQRRRPCGSACDISANRTALRDARFGARGGLLAVNEATAQTSGSPENSRVTPLIENRDRPTVGQSAGCGVGTMRANCGQGVGLD